MFPTTCVNFIVSPSTVAFSPRKPASAGTGGDSCRAEAYCSPVLGELEMISVKFFDGLVIARVTAKGQHLRYCAGSCPKGLRENTKPYSRDGYFPGRSSNSAPYGRWKPVRAGGMVNLTVYEVSSFHCGVVEALPVVECDAAFVRSYRRFGTAFRPYVMVRQ